MPKTQTGAQTNQLYILIETCRQPNRIWKGYASHRDTQTGIGDLVSSLQDSGHDGVVRYPGPEAHQIVSAFRFHRKK
jgi:hypothetical protein